METAIPAAYILSFVVPILTLYFQFIGSEHGAAKLQWMAVHVKGKPDSVCKLRWIVLYRNSRREDLFMQDASDDTIVLQAPGNVTKAYPSSTYKCHGLQVSFFGTDIKLSYRHFKPRAKAVIEVEYQKASSILPNTDDRISFGSKIRNRQHPSNIPWRRLLVRMIISLIAVIPVYIILELFLKFDDDKDKGILGYTTGDAISAFVAALVPIVIITRYVVHYRLAFRGMFWKKSKYTEHHPPPAE